VTGKLHARWVAAARKWWASRSRRCFLQRSDAALVGCLGPGSATRPRYLWPLSAGLRTSAGAPGGAVVRSGAAKHRPRRCKAQLARGGPAWRP